jgi:hypothetical protein
MFYSKVPWRGREREADEAREREGGGREGEKERGLFQAPAVLLFVLASAFFL